jgi:cell shape-determining protein MreC
MRKLQSVTLGFTSSRCSKTYGAIKLAQSQGGQAVSVEQRILDLPAFADYNDRRELRAIALDVRKLEDRVKQLEQENDSMRADLLLWNEKEVKL